jgi:hypothetical protein
MTPSSLEIPPTHAPDALNSPRAIGFLSPYSSVLQPAQRMPLDVRVR